MWVNQVDFTNLQCLTREEITKEATNQYFLNFTLYLLTWIFIEIKKLSFSNNCLSVNNRYHQLNF